MQEVAQLNEFDEVLYKVLSFLQYSEQLSINWIFVGGWMSDVRVHIRIRYFPTGISRT